MLEPGPQILPKMALPLRPGEDDYPSPMSPTFADPAFDLLPRGLKHSRSSCSPETATTS
jgi:hypothetical protein